MALGELIVRLSADVATFQSDLGRAQHMADQFGRKITQTLGALGVGISIAGLVAFGKESIDAAARLDDMAEKTGANVEELSKLSQVARISGTEISVVETFLIKLNKALHGTDEESKGASRALSAIGLSVSELKGLDPAEAMRRIAVELNKFADSGAKTAAILALTGKSAAEALPFLKDLATETGITAKVTAEQAAQAEELQKALRRLGNASTEAAQAIARELVPSLINAVEQFTKGKEIAGGFFNAIMLFGTINPFKTSGENIKSLTGSLDDLQKKKEELTAQGRTGWIPQVDAEIERTKKQIEFSKLLQRQEALALNTGRGRLDAKDPGSGARQLDFKGDAKPGAAGREDKTFENALKALEQQALKVQELTTFEETLASIEAGRYGKLLPAQREALINAAAAVDRAREDTTVQREAAAATEQYLKNVNARLTAEDNRLSNLRDGIIDMIDPLERFRKKMDEITELFARGFLTPEQFEAATFAIEKQANALSTVGDKVHEISDFARDMGSAFSSAFEDAIIGGKKFDDVVKSLGAAIARAMFQKSVTGPLNTAFTNFDWSKLLSGGGGGSYSGAGFSGEALGFATGTDYVRQTGLYKLHQGEAVIPAAENMRGGNVYIDATGADAAAISRLENAFMRLNYSVEPRAIAATTDFRRRGR